MFGQMDEGEIVESCLKTVDRTLATVDRAAVDDPEDALCGPVGFTGHHLGNEGIEGNDGDLGDDVAEEPGTVDVPRRDIGTDTVAPVLVLDPNGAAGSRRHDRMKAGSDRNLRLLVRTDDEFVPGERTPVPLPVIEVEDASRLGPELGMDVDGGLLIHGIGTYLSLTPDLVARDPLVLVNGELLEGGLKALMASAPLDIVGVGYSQDPQHFPELGDQVLQGVVTLRTKGSDTGWVSGGPAAESWQSMLEELRRLDDEWMAFRRDARALEQDAALLRQDAWAVRQDLLGPEPDAAPILRDATGSGQGGALIRDIDGHVWLTLSAKSVARDPLVRIDDILLDDGIEELLAKEPLAIRMIGYFGDPQTLTALGEEASRGIVIIRTRDSRAGGVPSESATGTWPQLGEALRRLGDDAQQVAGTWRRVAAEIQKAAAERRKAAAERGKAAAELQKAAEAHLRGDPSAVLRFQAEARKSSTRRRAGLTPTPASLTQRRNGWKTRRARESPPGVASSPPDKPPRHSSGFIHGLPGKNGIAP